MDPPLQAIVGAAVSRSSRLPAPQDPKPPAGRQSRIAITSDPSSATGSRWVSGRCCSSHWS